MYSLSDSDKNFVKTFLTKNGLDSYIAKGDWEGFWSEIGGPISDPQLNTFKTLFLTTCHLAGIDCHIEELADGWAFTSKGSILCIPDGILRIGEDAFIRNSRLKKLYIAPSVIEIGSSAFYGCDEIEEITLSKKWRDSIEKCILRDNDWYGIFSDRLRNTIKINYI